MNYLIKEISVERLNKFAKRTKIICLGCGKRLFEMLELYREETFVKEIELLLDNNINIWGERVAVGSRDLFIDDPKLLDKLPNSEMERILLITSNHVREIFDSVYELLSVGRFRVFKYPRYYSDLTPMLLKIFQIFPTRRQILFRAGKEPHDNADEIVRYLNEDFEGKRYRIVYLDDDDENTAGNEVIHLSLCTIRFKTTFLKLVKYCIIYACARYLCYENEVIEKISSKQTLIYLNHGTIPLKNVSDVLRQPDIIDLATCPGPGCVELYESQYHIPREKLIFMMPARVNRMLSSQVMTLPWKTEGIRKIILWLPTFRQLVGTQRKDSNVIDPIQLLTENSEEINGILEQNGELLLIKKHPREKEQLASYPELKNIVVIEDEDITDLGNNLQDLLKTADALLTDYSGIAFEYMLLDRPIGYVISDMDLYNRGFAVSEPEEYMPGIKIRNIYEFKQFLENISVGTDLCSNDRKRLVERLFGEYAYQNGAEKFMKYLERNM